MNNKETDESPRFCYQGKFYQIRTVSNCPNLIEFTLIAEPWTLLDVV